MLIKTYNYISNSRFLPKSSYSPGAVLQLTVLNYFMGHNPSTMRI